MEDISFHFWCGLFANPVPLWERVASAEKFERKLGENRLHSRRLDNAAMR